MKLFSKASEYAILVMMHVMETESLGRFSPKEMCAIAGIPEALSRRALVQLTKAHILRGTPGPGGGYRMVRDPADVSLLDIVLAVDGEKAFDECPLGMTCEYQSSSKDSQICDTCSFQNPLCGLGHICPMHKLWRQVRKVVVQYLESTTLQDIRESLCKTDAGIEV
jgi:DNA-binding IscR family transcriptional regulator